MTSAIATTPTPANDNTPRPSEFDARVMSYVPGLRTLAGRYVPPRYRDDLVTDTIIYALEKWRNYREDGGFWNWLSWGMRSVVKKQAQEASCKSRTANLVPIEDHLHLSTPATQLDAVEARDILRRLTGRDGYVVLRRAMGDNLSEIGTVIGVGKGYTQQIDARTRRRLVADTGWGDVA